MTEKSTKTKAKLSLGAADRIGCVRRPANVNAVSYSLTSVDDMTQTSRNTFKCLQCNF